MLRFPDDYVVGNLLLSDHGQLLARGEVDIPPQADYVGLKVHPTISDLSFLRELPADALQEISLHDCVVSDDDLSHLVHLTGLLAVDLSHTSITSAGLCNLAASPLRHLTIQYTRVHSLEWLKLFPQLELLDVSRCLIDDESLSTIPNDCNLQFLNLSDTRVSTEGVIKLIKRLPLKRLNLDRCRVDDRLLDQLKDAPTLSFVTAQKTPIDMDIYPALQALGRETLFPEPAFLTQSQSLPQAIGSTIRSQIFEVIVRQALAGAAWKEICAGPMQFNGITEQEVEAEIQRRKALPNS